MSDIKFSSVKEYITFFQPILSSVLKMSRKSNWYCKATEGVYNFISTLIKYKCFQPYESGFLAQKAEM